MACRASAQGTTNKIRNSRRREHKRMGTTSWGRTERKDQEEEAKSAGQRRAMHSCRSKNIVAVTVYTDRAAMPRAILCSQRAQPRSKYMKLIARHRSRYVAKRCSVAGDGTIPECSVGSWR